MFTARVCGPGFCDTNPPEQTVLDATIDPVRRATTLSAGRFSGYLFRPGGAYSIAICRIALFCYLLVHVYWGSLGNGIGDPVAYYQSANLGAYYPKGLVWLLFPAAPPPAWFISWLLPVAQISTILAMIGLLTRITMVVSVLSLCFLGAFIYSWEPLWSHPYNSGLLAGLGFMFGRAGDVLSVDALIARLFRGKSLVINSPVYWWPVILGTFGTAAVYFGGFYAKWSTPNFTYDLAWVFSDNLRNSVSLPWLIYGLPLPPQVSLVVDHPWLWQFCAAGHLAMQALPIFAVLSLGKPYVRLFEGIIFAAGTFLLREMMGFWNPEWMILTAFFVDWEFFLAKLRLRLSQPAAIHPVPGRNAIMGFAAVFMLANLLVIALRLDDKGNRLYPFSSMTFYSSVAAEKPYDQHLHYPFSYGELLLNYSTQSQKWHCYPGISTLYVPAFNNNDIKTKFEGQLGAIRAVEQHINGMAVKEAQATDCPGSINIRDFQSIDLFASVLDIPPYPESVRFEVGYRALVGRYERDRDRLIVAAGGVRNVAGAVAVDVTSSGLDVERYEILLANDPWKHYKIGSLIEPTGQWREHSFEIDKDFYAKLPTGWYPIVVRVAEKSGSIYDFFGGILYR